MIKKIESKADTIEGAINKALIQLGVTRDDVSVEVISKPKSGFLGIGKEPAVVSVTYSCSPADTARDFIEGLLVRMGVTANVDVSEDQENKLIRIELSGEHMNAVIGRRGDTLDAIQYLTSIIANREDEDDRWHILVDTENYRQKRENTLKNLADKTAAKALKYQKSIALEAMNAQERRIIHSRLQGNPAVTTYSVGSDPNRKVIVAPAGMPQQRSNKASPKKNRDRRPQKPSAEA